MKKSQLIQISKHGDYMLYEYSPSIFHLFGEYYFEKIKIRRIIRFCLALASGYKIYYYVKEHTPVAYCTVQNGRARRFDFSTDADIVIGPYVVDDLYRGNGIAASLINQILLLYKNRFERAFVYIKKDNIASIKTCKKLGFDFYSDARVTPLKADVKSINGADSKHLILYISESDIKSC